MKSHAQPGLPPTPFIFRMAAASRPENAEAIEVAENMIAMLQTRGYERLCEKDMPNDQIPQLELPPRVEGREVKRDSGQQTACNARRHEVFRYMNGHPRAHLRRGPGKAWPQRARRSCARRLWHDATISTVAMSDLVPSSPCSVQVRPQRMTIVGTIRRGPTACKRS